MAIHRDRRAGLAIAPPEFSVQGERDSDVYLITVTGELDLSTHEALAKEVARAQATDPARIVLDLSHAAFVDSSGIRVVLQAARAAAGRFRLMLPAKGQVRESFELTGVLPFITIIE